MPIRAVITRRWCKAKDNVQDASKLYVICRLQILVNNVPYNVWLSVITLIRTDTTLDLSQKAEKSMIQIYEIAPYVAFHTPQIKITVGGCVDVCE